MCLVVLSLLSLLHHLKDDVILPYSGLAKKDKKNWWIFILGREHE